MKIKVHQLNKQASIPKKTGINNNIFNLIAISREIDNNGCIVYKTGLAFEIPLGYIGLIVPYDSISNKDIILSNCVGIINSMCSEEVIFRYKHIDNINKAISTNPNGHYVYRFTTGIDYQPGDIIGQLIIITLPEIEFEY